MTIKCLLLFMIIIHLRLKLEITTYIFFIITNRSEKKMLFSSSLNTDFDKLCDSLIKCITTDVKKQIPKKFLKAKGFL